MVDFIGWIGVWLFVLLVLLCVLLAGFLGYHLECESPRQDAILLAFRIENLWLREPHVPNSAAKVAAIFEPRKDLKVFARRAADGDEIVIAPSHWYWSVCRPTIVIFDHGKQSR
jgi:hypothetical protein